VPHQIATQKTRIKAEQLGWQNWKPARSLMRIGLPKVPDGEALSPDSQCVAIEVEREIKTDRRYEAVVGASISLTLKRISDGLVLTISARMETLRLVWQGSLVACRSCD
jgi:hypothetical protein